MFFADNLFCCYICDIKEENWLQIIRKSWSRLIRSDTTQTIAYSAGSVLTVFHSARWHPQTGVKFDTVWFSVSIDAVLSISISISLIINISSIGSQSTLEDVWLSARQTSSLHPWHWLFLLSPALYSLAIIFLSLHTLFLSACMDRIQRWFVFTISSADLQQLFGEACNELIVQSFILIERTTSKVAFPEQIAVTLTAHH